VNPGPDQVQRWTGAGQIPALGVGYWSATTPLVLVQLEQGTLTVRLRPAWFGRLTGTKTLRAAAAEVETFRVRDRSAYQGIEFRPPRRSSFYFYTRRRDAVLSALEAAGFVISPQPGREKPTWYQPDDD
jgi:hypothetical protein